MYDILVDLFETLEEGGDTISNRENILLALKSAGMKEKDIHDVAGTVEKVVALQGLVQKVMPHGGFAMRHYSPEEQKCLDRECRGFLLHLEQKGLLPPELREVVIDQALKLGDVDFDVTRLRLLVLLVLFQKAGLDTIVNHYKTLADSHHGAVIN